jgi:hypothetical protein
MIGVGDERGHKPNGTFNDRNRRAPRSDSSRQQQSSRRFLGIEQVIGMERPIDSGVTLSSRSRFTKAAGGAAPMAISFLATGS